KFDLTRVIKNSPLQNANAPYGLLMDSQTREAQEAGGTWSELYPRNSPLNQSQPLAVLAWLALMEVLGLATFPLIALATRMQKVPGTLPTLADGGYSFAKALGLLLVAVSVWWIGSLQWLQITPAVLWGAVVVLIAVGAHFWFHQRSAMFSLIKSRWKIILASEVVFLVALGVWLWVRAGNPDLWHRSMGGEKPMDLPISTPRSSHLTFRRLIRGLRVGRLITITSVGSSLAGRLRRWGLTRRWLTTLRCPRCLR
ncbi:MAG: hypothetical protein HC853_03595, partial [Anaerolineae bacterium]|nr:hypothetical protein [Anaerolineae bacterium]